MLLILTGYLLEQVQEITKCGPANTGSPGKRPSKKDRDTTAIYSPRTTKYLFTSRAKTTCLVTHKSEQLHINLSKAPFTQYNLLSNRFDKHGLTTG